MSTRNLEFSSDDVFNLLKAAYDAGKIGVSDPEAPPKPDNYKLVPGERFIGSLNDKANAVDLDIIGQMLVLATPLIATLGSPVFSMMVGQMLSSPTE